MDESKKGTSAPTDSKESSSFDGDFGKNFLSSWKSAKTGKDQIDFDVESVPRNKKTAFNFDKLDDFELGGDFDKLSSFKMNMPDLDFSSPVKKSEKPKVKSCEEIVSGKKKVEQDKFSFSFNFNELDKFDLDPNLLKGEEKIKKSVADGGKDTESIIHDDNHESVIHDKSQPLKDKSNNRNDVSKNSGTKRFLNVESTEMPRSEHLIEPNTANCAFPSVSDRGHQDVSREAVTSSEKKLISVGEKEKAMHSGNCGEKQQSDGSSFLKRYSENARPNLSRLSVSSDSSAKEALPQIKSGLASLDLSKADPARELDDTARSIDRSQSQNSSPANSSNSGSWRRASTTESPNNSDDTQKIPGNPSQVTRGSMVPSESTKSHQDLDNACAANFPQHPKFLPSPLHRGSMLLKSVSLNEKAITALQLKPLSTNESQKTSAPTTRQPNAVDSGKTRSTNVCPDYDNRESKQNTATEVGNQKTQDKSSAKDTSVITGSGKNDKSDSSLVQHPSSILTGQTTVTNNVKNILPSSFSTTAAKKSLQCISAERQGISLRDRKMYDIGSLKLSGVTKSNINTSNFTMQKETMAARTLERKLEVPLNTVSKQSNCATAKKYALSSPSLKRKILEESKTDPESFNPLKRVMESTTQTRELLEVSPTINKRLEVSPKVDSNLVLGTGNPEAYQGNVSMDTLDYSNRVPEMKNLVDLELPVLIENDGNVEKAEACAKELDDICNMLRKKNEEAKELLVRSVVNTNALMMLNHPMYDEKIRTLQKKFVSLNSREF